MRGLYFCIYLCFERLWPCPDLVPQVLGRPGFSIADKKRRTGRIGFRHRIRKEEAMRWFQQKVSVENPDLPRGCLLEDVTFVILHFCQIFNLWKQLYLISTYLLKLCFQRCIDGVSKNKWLLLWNFDPELVEFLQPSQEFIYKKEELMYQWNSEKHVIKLIELQYKLLIVWLRFNLKIFHFLL